MLRSLALTALLLVPAPVLAQQAPTLTMTGSAQMTVLPDTTTLRGTISATEETAQAAHREASQRLDALLAAAKPFGNASRSRIAMGQVRGRGKSLLGSDEAGFFARGSVAVTLSKRDDLPKALDAMAGAGITGTVSIGHDVADRAALFREARTRAAADAIARAETYAQAASVTLGQIIDIVESGSAGATATRDIDPSPSSYSGYDKGAPAVPRGSSATATVRIRWALE